MINFGIDGGGGISERARGRNWDVKERGGSINGDGGENKREARKKGKY